MKELQFSATVPQRTWFPYSGNGNVVSVLQQEPRLFDERLEAIRKATGNERKAAWASLVHCRTSKTPATTLYALPDLKALRIALQLLCSKTSGFEFRVSG